jgi:hypothetical protein
VKKLIYLLTVLVICTLTVSCSFPGVIPEQTPAETQKPKSNTPPEPAPAEPEEADLGSGLGTVIELRIIAGADDASENAREVLVADTDLRVHSYPGATPWQRTSAGLRFQGVDIPQGATIITSHVLIYPTTADANDINCNIYVENTGDADDFVNNPHIINEDYRPRTTHYTAWIEDDLDIDTYVKSPLLNNPLQELFNRPDWAAGNDLVILMIANEDIDKNARFWHQEKYLDLPAELFIEYID